MDFGEAIVGQSQSLSKIADVLTLETCVVSVLLTATTHHTIDYNPLVSHPLNKKETKMCFLLL